MDDFSTWEIVKGVMLVLLTIVQAIVIPAIIKLLKKTEEIHHETNSMKDALVKATKELGESVGFAKGEAAEKKKTGVKLP